MPQKSILEMSVFERLHYSLGGKTFRAIVLFSLIISIAAVAFGFFFYSSAIDREYRTKTWYYSRMAAQTIDMDEARSEAETTVGIYDALDESERALRDDPEYLEEFSSIRGEGFEALRRSILEIQNATDAIASYVAFLDVEHNRMVFIADSDPKQSFCPPGKWDEFKSKEIDGFINGAKPKPLDGFYGAERMPSVITRIPQYGYRCTACTKLFDIGKYPVFIFFDTDMNRVANASREFLLHYLLLLFVVTAVVVIFAIRHMKKTTVEPINALASAALAYTKDSMDGSRDSRHFGQLNIKTGDEIEGLALTMKTMEEELDAYMHNLMRATAEKERISTELSLATKIQAGMLPSIFPAFPNRSDFDIYAKMDPAKEVGGDFYDFFMIDDDQLAMVIADVSGKGIPAALFMMGSKILIQNYTMTGISPKEVLEKVNERICTNNREEMFVTVWLGILDLVTGKLTAANAGHEYPVLKSADGSFEVLKDKHGFVIGGMPGMKYSDYELQLKPGAKLFVYTDGVPEATSKSGELFGMERMLETLRSAENGTAVDILNAVEEATDEFAADAPQFDDLTMLCLHYIGSKHQEAHVKELTIEAKVQSIEVITDFINSELEKLDCATKARSMIDVAADEAVSNIARCAYGPEGGDVTVRFDAGDGKNVAISFIDGGVPFDPLSYGDPDTELPIQERQIGGLGIFLIKKTMDDVRYEYRDNKNILTIVKNIGGSDK